ncbi:MAG: gamma-glutamyl-gamma-aminobutyrate hydrolase family protein [Oscillospiraceae bacterium]|nr:gamma-glutamyl-gamma-aminobutyrate hydrolase family protein [Oscillospiraceae bacterium]
MKPIIGILPSYDQDKKQIFLDDFYLDEITSSGGFAVVLAPTLDKEAVIETLDRIDGLVISGGVDIDPKYYGKENTGKSVGITPLLDESEYLYITLALEKDLPILGICRGMQALNVFGGGTLIQDIPTEYKTETIHNLEKPDVAFHNLTVLPDNPLADMIGPGEHRINSYHHQAVDELAPFYAVAAVSEDGLVESIYRTDKKFVLGVQWHPERDFHVAINNKKIVDGFIKVCCKD